MQKKAAKITPPKSPRGDKNSRCLAEFENSDLLACPIFPQCQPKVDKKLNLRLKKYLRRDILPVAAVVRNHL